MAHKKGLGSSRNGRDSNPKSARREDLRRPGREGRDDHRPPARHALPPGRGAGIGRDDTIFAKRDGTVAFRTQRRAPLRFASSSPSGSPSAGRARCSTTAPASTSQAGRGGDGALCVPAREVRARRAGRTAATAAAGGDVVLVADPDLRDLSRFRPNQRFKAGRGGSGGGANKHGADGDDVELRVPVGTQVFDDDGQLIADLARPGARVRRSRAAAAAAAATSASRRRRGRRRASPRRAARRGGDDRAAAEAARRRGARRPPERGQVVAPAPDLEREAEGRRLPVHDARAGARHRRRAGRAAAHRRRRAGADRGRERGRRARPRVPRAPRARAAARARDRRVARTSSRALRARSTASSRSTAPASTSGRRSSC